MADKDKLAGLLSGTSPKSPIKRGQPMRLSTEAPTTENQETQPSAKSHKRTNAQSHQAKAVRVNRGYKLREDLIKACKRLALEQDRPLYEIMEEALSEYLSHKRTNA